MPPPSLFADSMTPVATFRGGFTRGMRWASPYLRTVQLDLFAEGVRVAPVRRLLTLVVPTWECPFDRLTDAEVSGRANLKGVRFRSEDNPGVDRPTITFVPCRELAEVLAALGSAGVDVRR